MKVNWVDGFDEKGRPIPVPGIAPTKEGTLVYPGNQGGTNWYSPSFSPRTGLFYVPAWENTSTTYIKGDTAPEFKPGGGFTGLFPRPGLATDDVHSSIQAIDPKTGTKRWTYRINTPSTEAGVLTTASDMLFSGARDGSFFALDARPASCSGRRISDHRSPPTITYAVNGRQYVDIVAGNSMFTFGLREPAAPADCGGPAAMIVSPSGDSR